MWSKLLYKDVNGCPLEKRLSFVLSQGLNSCLSLILMLMGFTIVTAFVIYVFGYPRVLQDVLRADSYLRVNRYHLLNQIFCIRRHSFWDVELAFLDLAEHLAL